MKILQVITSLRKSAGTTTFVKGLSEALYDLGFSITIAITSLDDECLGERPERPISIVTIHEILQNGEHFDIVHIHGLWEFATNRICRWALKHRISVVWSAHGALSPWAMNHKRWKKMLPWIVFQRSNLKAATLLHATADSEVEWIRRSGLQNDIVVAPLGVGGAALDQAAIVGKNENERTLLFVGRIHPVKGLSNLLKAWATCRIRYPEIAKIWKLVLVGPDQVGYRTELEKQANRLLLGDSVVFKGPEFGITLQAEYSTCDCLLLPNCMFSFLFSFCFALRICLRRSRRRMLRSLNSSSLSGSKSSTWS